MKSTKEIIDEIQKTEITWIASQSDPCMFDAVFAGEHVQLRLNDFPDEPIHTLFVRDEEIDLEESPVVWHLQHTNDPRANQ